MMHSQAIQVTMSLKLSLSVMRLSGQNMWGGGKKDNTLVCQDSLKVVGSMTKTGKK